MIFKYFFLKGQTQIFSPAGKTLHLYCSIMKDYNLNRL